MKKKIIMIMTNLVVVSGLLMIALNMKNEKLYPLHNYEDMKTVFHEEFNMTPLSNVFIEKKLIPRDEVCYYVLSICQENKGYFLVMEQDEKSEYRCVHKKILPLNGAEIVVDKKNHLFIGYVAGLEEQTLGIDITYKDGRQSKEILHRDGFIIFFRDDPQIENIAFEKTETDADMIECSYVYLEE